MEETINFEQIYQVAMKRGLFVRNLGVGLKIRQYSTRFIKNKKHIRKRQEIRSKIVEVNAQYWAIDLLQHKRKGETAVFLKMVGDRFYPIEKVEVGILTGETQLF